jgi:diguanylate cyclase (GGDEF)-like protein/PAS domain S-box-containing protein
MQSDDGVLSLLLVEDNIGDARLIEILLAEEMAGDFRMRKATTLAAACKALLPEGDMGGDVMVGPDIDVVLLDLTLPDSQGLDTLRALQRHCGTVPVVVLSGLDDEALALKALQLGAEDYLVKGRADGNLIKRSALYAIERSRMRRNALLTEAAFQATDTGIVILDRHHRVSRINPAMVRISGYAEADLVGQSLDILAPTHEQDIPETDASLMSSEKIFSELDPLAGWEGELWSQRHSGEVFPIWLRVNGVSDQRSILEGYVAVISDITHRKKAEAELRRMATRDTLTGLPNRGLFISLLEDAVDHVTDSVFEGSAEGVGDEIGSGCGLLFIDLDGFKAVNDTFGHEAGDEVLKSVARRLKSTVRASDRVARLAGDEFVILLSDARHLKDAANVAHKVIEEVARPVSLSGGETAKVSASIGIALCPSDSRSPDGLLRAADAAMYRAKKTGKNKWCAYRDVAAE